MNPKPPKKRLSRRARVVISVCGLIAAWALIGLMLERRMDLGPLGLVLMLIAVIGFIWNVGKPS